MSSAAATGGRLDDLLDGLHRLMRGDRLDPRLERHTPTGEIIDELPLGTTAIRRYELDLSAIEGTYRRCAAHAEDTFVPATAVGFEGCLSAFEGRP